MRWIWLRHGETEANAERRYIGHSDSPLTAGGRAQAISAADRLRDAGIGVTKLCSSDSGRCVQTAELLGGRLGLEPVRAAELRELDFGRWEGMTYAQIMASDRALAVSWYEDPFAAAPPGGETLNGLGGRIDRWLARELASSRADDTIVVVSHGGPIRWFLSRHVRGDERTYWQTEGVKPGQMVSALYDGNVWRMADFAGSR